MNFGALFSIDIQKGWSKVSDGGIIAIVHEQCNDKYKFSNNLTFCRQDNPESVKEYARGESLDSNTMTPSRRSEFTNDQGELVVAETFEHTLNEYPVEATIFYFKTSPLIMWIVTFSCIPDDSKSLMDSVLTMVKSFKERV